MFKSAYLHGIHTALIKLGFNADSFEVGMRRWADLNKARASYPQQSERRIAHNRRYNY